MSGPVSGPSCFTTQSSGAVSSVCYQFSPSSDSGQTTMASADFFLRFPPPGLSTSVAAIGTPEDLPRYDAPAFTLMPAASTPTPSVQTLDFRDSGLLIRCVRLCGSCSTGQRFALGFLPTDASRRRSCPSARPSFCKAAIRPTFTFVHVSLTSRCALLGAPPQKSRPVEAALKRMREVRKLRTRAWQACATSVR